MGNYAQEAGNSKNTAPINIPEDTMNRKPLLTSTILTEIERLS